MSLKSSDLFYVQRPSGGDAGNYKMNAGELIDFIGVLLLLSIAVLLIVRCSCWIST